MRKLVAFGFILLLIGCKTKQKTVEESPSALTVLTTNEIPIGLKDKAYSLGKRVLMTCNTSRFKPFTKEEATTAVN